MEAVELDWDAAEFLEAVKGKLAENMVMACGVVWADAKQKLLAIKEPEWGGKYRQRIVAPLLTYQVEQTASEVVGLVGIGEGPKGKDHGYWIEMGSKTAPAQPFLRSALAENAGTIVELLMGE